MNHLNELEASFLKPNVPNVKIGQTVRVSLNIVEGDKQRIQVYEGVVIGKQGGGHRETATVRKVSYGVGVERVFPLHSPLIQQVKVVREGEVKRAKLYYLRELSGRAGRLTDKERATPKGRGASPIPVQEALPTPVSKETLPASSPRTEDLSVAVGPS